MLQQRLRLGSCGSRQAAAGLQDAAAAAAARCTLPVSRCTVARCTQSAQWVSFALSLGRFAEFVMVLLLLLLLLFCYFIHCFINCICNLRPIVAAVSDHQIDCASACWLLLLVLLLGLIWPNLWLHLTLLTVKDLCL